MLNESKTGHIMVGLFVVVAAVAFAWLLFSQQQGPNDYSIVAEFDTMGSINEATKVKLRGFTIGQVKGVEFRPRPPKGEAYFLVELGIDKRYEVPQGTIAEIRGSGLVGETYVFLDVAEAGVLLGESVGQKQADVGVIFERGNAALEEEFDTIGAVGWIGKDEVAATVQARREFEAEVGEVGGDVEFVRVGAVVYKGQQPLIEIGDGDAQIGQQAGQGQAGQVVVAETEDLRAGQIVGRGDVLCALE